MANFASLLIDASDYSRRTDFSHLYQDFVRRAEAKFNAVLRISNMEKMATVTLVDGAAALPADFLEARSVVGGGRNLRSASLQYLTERYGQRGGSPDAYVISGAEFQAFPRFAGGVTLDYYAKIPPLTAASPTNWLIELSDAVYLYGVVEEISIWEASPDKVAAVRSLKAEALRDLMLNDERGRWGNAQVRVGGMTP